MDFKEHSEVMQLLYDMALYYGLALIIDEDGFIYKCGFGTWSYAKIQEYLNGGFSKQFKKFNQKFYKVFIPKLQNM